MNTVRDGRQRPYFQVVKDDVRAIEEACAAPEVTVKLAAVRSTYFALLEFANDERADETSVTRKALAEKAGVSSRTSQEATAVLEAAGVLAIEERRGLTSTGNIWVLLDAPNRRPLPVQTGAHCLANRRPLPVSIVTNQEEKKKPPSPREEDLDGDAMCFDVPELHREPQPSVAPPAEPSNTEMVVFEFWSKTMNHPRSVLDSTRRRTIYKALKFATPEECLRAIEGCSTSDFHMARGEYARNDSRQDHLSLILRNRENVERFMEMAPKRAGVPAAIKQAQLAVITASQMAGNVGARRAGEEAERTLAEAGYRVILVNGEHPRFERVGLDANSTEVTPATMDYRPPAV